MGAAIFAGLFLIYPISATQDRPNPQEGPPVESSRDADRKFAEWQKLMFEQRSRLSESLRKVLYKKVKVPPPEATRPDELTPVTFEFGRRFFSLLPPVVIEAGVGKPRAYVGVKVRGEALEFFALERRVGVAFSARDNSIAFQSSVDAKFGMEKEGKPSVGLGGGASFNVLAQEVESSGAEFSIRVGLFEGGIGVDTEGQVTLFGEAGPSWKVGKYAQIGLTLEGEISAPMCISNVRFGSNYGMWSFASDTAARIARWLTEPGPCPYCREKGVVTCSECQNAGYVACPSSEPCGRCSGRGMVGCPETESCSRCQGTGGERCPRYTTRTENVTVWRKVLVDAGFDESGQPYERWEERPFTETRSVTVPCERCNGTGWCGTCANCGGSGQVRCSTCAGAGVVSCSRCNGTGSVSCTKCGGSGRKTCSSCQGHPDSCRLCSGTGRLKPR